MSNYNLQPLVRKTAMFARGADARAEGKPRSAPTEYGYTVEHSDSWLAGWDYMNAKITTLLNQVCAQCYDFRMPGEPTFVVRVHRKGYLQRDGSWGSDPRLFTDPEWAAEVAKDYANGRAFRVMSFGNGE